MILASPMAIFLVLHLLNLSHGESALQVGAEDCKQYASRCELTYVGRSMGKSSNKEKKKKLLENLLACLQAYDILDVNGLYFTVNHSKKGKKYPRTGLMLAAEAGLNDLARDFIHLPGADINRNNEVGTGTTALHRAAHAGNLNMAKILLGLGANKHHKNKFGYTPLMLARGYGHSEIVKELKKERKHR